MLKLVYEDISPTAKQDSTITCTDKKSYIDLEELKDNDLKVNQYATCEYHRTLLNGNFPDFPNTAPKNLGYESLNMSNSLGNFTTAITMTRTFSSRHNASGITFVFDSNEDKCYCTHLNVKWYRDATLLKDCDYYPNHVQYFCEQQVEAFNKIIITYYSTNKPYRFLRISRVDDGVIREFYQEELQGIKIIEEISETLDSLSINTADISMKAKNDISFMFQRTQPLLLYDNEILLGKFFTDTSKIKTHQRYTLSANDYIGILDNEQFYGGIYSNKSVNTLIKEILGDIPYTYTGNETISGYLPICSKRSALQKIAFATCNIVDCSRSENIIINKLSSSIKTIPASRVIADQTEEVNKMVTKLELTEHKFVANSEVTELLNEVLTGTVTLTFSEPHHTYTISGGTIVNSGVNYVTITGTGATVILTGRGYTDITRVISLSNPFVTATDMANVISKSDNKLITSDNSATVLQTVAPLFFKTKTLAITIKIEDEKVGDRVSLPTSLGTKQGRIISIDFDPKTKYSEVIISEE